MAYQDLSGGERIDAWDFGTRPLVEGVLESRRENVGDNNSMFYHLREKTTGELVGIWGCTVLDRQFKLVRNGEQVRVTFLGMEDSPNRRGKQYKNFKVEVDR